MLEMDQRPDPEKIAEANEKWETLLQSPKRGAAALVHVDRLDQIVVTFFFGRVSLFDIWKSFFEREFEDPGRRADDFVLVFPLLVEREDRCARRIGRRHALRWRRKAVVDVRAEASEIFFDVTKFGDGRAADQVVPEVIVEFSANSVFAFAELGLERFLVFRVETEMRFDNGDVARKDFAVVNFVLFVAVIMRI